jgi:cytochrome d ubiquinol oxidase subunit I
MLRTADAMTPFLTTRAAAVSLVVFCTVYSFIFGFGVFYIYRLLRTGPVDRLIEPPVAAIPNRPMSVVDPHAHIRGPRIHDREAVESVRGGERT